MSKRWSFRVLVVAGAFIVGMGSQAAFALTPTIAVTPNTNLINLQKVKIAGKNLLKSTSYFIVECNPKVKTLPGAQAQNACDLKTGQYMTAKTTATGTLAVTFAVHTGTIGTGTGAATCGHLHPCLLTASPGAATGSATATISFK
jgi:hypothetical protein